MKIFVKTLKGARFEIQVKPEDSVADVKKNIETVLGVTAAEQVLIHKGKVLKDETTVEANNVSEKSVIAVLKVHDVPSYSTATMPPRLSMLVVPVTLKVNYESVSESNIQQILEVARGGWSREVVAYALCLAHNDVDIAFEYLYFGIPVLSEDPYITEGTQEQIQEPEAHEVADQERSLDFLRHTPEVLEQPQELQDDDVLHFQSNEPNKGGDSGNQVGESEETKVEQPQADPNNGGGDGGNQVGESEETKVEVPTPEDYELIERLEALGFERGDAAVAYFACNRNIQVAANHLLGYKHESRRE
ncbi:hypothetical protein N665_2609s0006 [Sinapis alba]|nr:hypothetical protein N665_2609s0006 [Sinapis alba]